MKRPQELKGWVNFALRNAKLVYLTVLALTVIGGIGLVRMNKDEYPTFELKQGLVAGIYPGAGARQVEDELTGRLEEILFSFKEVERNAVRSVTKDGICYIYVDLNCPQRKKDQVWSKIKLKLQEQKALLPTGVLAVAVLDDFSAVSSLLLALESDDKSYAELSDYADDLCTRLRRLPNLASVSVLGRQEEEIAVTLDRDKLSAYAVDVNSLFLRFQTSGLSLPAGSFDTDYTSAPIRVSNPASSEKQISEQIIWSDPAGGIIRLKDVAKVERRCKAPDSFVTYNGHSCLIISVEMRPDNNIVRFGEEMDVVLDEFMKEMPDSVTISRISDQPKVVGDSIYSFLRDLLISMLVVILVMLMLFPLKSALIAGSGVPVCTAISIGIMYVVGIDLNTVTLGGLIATLGMIVDNSIITMDGYMGKLGAGLSRPDAADRSVRELFPPTLAATLAICAMFFPATFIISGYLGDFVQIFPWVFVIALMVSLVYAVSVVPSLEVKFITSDKSEGKGIISKAQNAFFNGMECIYSKAEAFCFRHPSGTLLTGLAIVGLGVFFFFRLNIQMMPKAARDFFVVETEMEGGCGLAQTKARTDSIQAILLADERVESVTAFIGTGAPRFCTTYNPVLPGKTVSQMIVNTRSKKATEELLKEYEVRYDNVFPDALVRFKQMDYQMADAPLVVSLRGENRDELITAAERIKSYMCASMSDEVKWIHSTCDDFVSSMNIELDEDEASRLGVNRAMLSLSLMGTLNGMNVETCRENGRDIPVNVYNSGFCDTMSYEAVRNVMVSTMIPGVSVPLRQVATVTPEWSAVTLEKRAGEESISIFADMKDGCSQPAAAKKLKKFIDSEISVPDGARVEFEGLTRINAQVAPEILWSFIGAVLILFIFLLIHFKKVRLSALTLVMSSLCLFGASLGLVVFNLDFGLTAVLGLISLVGIIVRNGIILFEYAEELHFKDGLSVRDAAIKAGAMRMRPIFLTSCTTALGVLPMVIGGDLLWQPMGVVICFGTLLSIFLIVLIMPVSYWQLYKHYDKA